MSMRRMILSAVICTAFVPAMAFCEGGMVQRKPDPQAVFSALGIQSWQIELPLSVNQSYGLAVYSKSEYKPPVPINGILNFNFPGGPKTGKLIVTIAIQSVHKANGESRFLVGMNANGSTWNYEIETPFSPSAAYAFGESDLKMDAKGRVLLAYSEGTQSISPGRDIDEYSSAIYLELAPRELKESK